MNLVWIVITLILIGYVGERFVFSKERLPAFLRDTFLTGWEFILIGALIGPGGFEIISMERLEQLDPFIALGLGWAGLIFGSQMRREDLLKVDPAAIKLTVTQVLTTMVGIFAVYFILSAIFLPLSWGKITASALVVAGAGAISSPTALSIMSPRFPRSKSTLIRLLMIIATLDLAPALIIVGGIFCFLSPQDGGTFSFSRGWEFLGYSIIVAMALAGLFRFFGRKNLKPEENLAVLIGFIVFVSGVAFYLSLSPLFLSLLVGIILANVLKHDDGVFSLLYLTEKPFYVMLLLVTGMWWSEGGVAVWGLAATIVAARLWLKREVIDRYSSFLPAERRPPSGTGLALGAQGALAPAIGLNYLLVYPGDGARFAFGVIVIAMIINEAMAPFLIRRALGEDSE